VALDPQELSNMSKRVIIVGHGDSGKDTLKARFIERGYKPSISYTTRPPREGEVNGKDYFFVDREEFMKMVDNGEFYEWQEFGSEHGLDALYGTTKEHFFAADIFIMTPDGLKDLKPEDRPTSMIIYLNIDEEVRRQRLSERNDFDTVENRLERDNKQFKDFTDFDIQITNNNF
jgi:guanylate kinase